MEHTQRMKVREWIKGKLEAGLPENQIVDELMEKGIAEEDAVRETLYISRLKTEAIENAPEITKRKRKQGSTNAIIGGITTLFGLFFCLILPGDVELTVSGGIIMISGLVFVVLGIRQIRKVKEETASTES